MVKYFVEKGADLHHNNDIILIIAANGGHKNVVKYLIDQGLELRGHPNIHKYSKDMENYIQTLLTQK